MPTLVSGGFGFGEATAASGTAFIVGIAPYPGTGNAAPELYAARPGTSGAGNWVKAPTTRVQQVLYQTTGNVHKLTLMRPFNFAYITTAVAKNTATFVLDKDPGLYATTLRYPLPGGLSCAVADNAAAAGDYVAYQLADGTWIFDIVASGTFAALVLTANVPNITASTGVPAGTPMFFFGVVTDKDPNTGQLNPQFTMPAATTATLLNNIQATSEGSLWSALHPGDPMILYSPNGTTLGITSNVNGIYVKNP